MLWMPTAATTRCSAWSAWWTTTTWRSCSCTACAGSPCATKPKRLVVVLQQNSGAADAPPAAPPGNLAARVGTPLRRAARLLHRCHRLRARGHARICANQAYLDTFGYESFDDLLGLPVLDMINGSHAVAGSSRCCAAAGRRSCPRSWPCRRAARTCSSFDATVEFAPATFEGEPCLQIVFRRQLVDPAVLEQLRSAIR